MYSSTHLCLVMVWTGPDLLSLVLLTLQGLMAGWLLEVLLLILFLIPGGCCQKILPLSVQHHPVKSKLCINYFAYTVVSFKCLAEHRIKNKGGGGVSFNLFLIYFRLRYV